jgi:hypothetical protein
MQPSRVEVVVVVVVVTSRFVVEVTVLFAATEREVRVKALPKELLSTLASANLVDLVTITSTALAVETFDPDVGGEFTATVTPPTPFWKPLRCAS